MAVRTLITEGYGNGTFNGTIPLIVTRGYAIVAVEELPPIPIINPQINTRRRAVNTAYLIITQLGSLADLGIKFPIILSESEDNTVVFSEPKTGVRLVDSGFGPLYEFLVSEYIEISEVEDTITIRSDVP